MPHTIPYKVIASISVPNVADARDKLVRAYGCKSDWLRNAAGQSFEVYRCPDGRVFALAPAFGKGRGLDIRWTLQEVEPSE